MDFRPKTTYETRQIRNTKHVDKTEVRRPRDMESKSTREMNFESDSVPTAECTKDMQT